MLDKRSRTGRLVAVAAVAMASLTVSCASGRPVNPGEVAQNADVIAQNAMVAAAHPAASAAGLEILRQGGNAVDAAVAAAFALSIAEPNASGVGGGGFITVKLAASPVVGLINYRETAAAAVTPEMYYGPGVRFSAMTTEGPHAVGVPGLVAGAAMALEKYGTMTLAQVLQPAIRLCREGIEVSSLLNSMILDNYDKLAKSPAAAAIYLPDGMPLEAGDTLRNPDLAVTLEKIAAAGPTVFYEGEIGQAIVAELQRLGGVMTLEDLKGYEASPQEPLTGTYRGYELVTASPPSSGGPHLIQLLNIVEGFDVRSMGFGSARHLHVLGEAMKMVFADKTANSGDPRFVEIPVDRITDKAYATELRERIRDGEARFDYTSRPLTVTAGGSTTHLSVVDAQGNVVALTQSINAFFGAGIVVPGTGILLNNHLNDFDSQDGGPNAIGPGRRPASNMAPTLVFKDGQPFLTVGTPGGTRILSALGQIVINLVDFDMSMSNAIQAPRIHNAGRIMAMEGRFSEDVVATLKGWGHEIRLYPEFDNYFGGAQAIMIDARRRRLYGAADQRRDGVAIGY
jgi:gamma-glutamyltranspeptidase / glutathione hydrolase